MLDFVLTVTLCPIDSQPYKSATQETINSSNADRLIIIFTKFHAVVGVEAMAMRLNQPITRMRELPTFPDHSLYSVVGAATTQKPIRTPTTAQKIKPRA